MRHRLLLFGLCACVLAGGLACDSANPVAPTGTVLTVTANPSQISLNGGSSRITVTGFKPDGNPLNPGTQILVSSDLGNLFLETGESASVIEIGSGGQAIALLRGDGRSGPATVTATLTTGGEASATATVQIGATDADKPRLIISANPTTVSIGALSRVSFLGRNSDNTPVPAGQRIRLTADLGTLVDDGGDAGAPSIDAVFTDANGEAFATFVAGDRSGSGRVAGILGTSDEATVTITINDAPDSFSFQATPRLVRASEGDAVINLTAQVLNALGSPVGSATVVFGANTPGTFASGSGSRPTVSGVATDTFTVLQAQLVAGQPFNVTARVIGEGVELPTQTLQITVDP